MNAVGRHWVAVEEAVGIHEEILDSLLGEHLIQARRESALGQPEPPRPPAHVALDGGQSDGHLSAYGVGRQHQGQQAVRGRASEHLQAAGILKLLEDGDQIAATTVIVESFHLAEPFEVVPGGVALLFGASGVPRLPLGQLNPFLEIASVSAL